MKTSLPPHPFIGVLAERRRKVGMTYLQVAEAAGVAESSVYRALNRDSEPHFTTVVAIAHALGVPMFLADKS